MIAMYSVYSGKAMGNWYEDVFIKILHKNKRINQEGHTKHWNTCILATQNNLWVTKFDFGNVLL